MLILNCPNFRVPEREYTVRVIFEEFLGLKCTLIPYGEDHWRLTDPEAKSCLIMPDSFFSMTRTKWLRPGSLPEQPLPTWNVASDLPSAVLIKPDLPIIAGQINQDGTWFSRPAPNITQLGLDFMGAAFFMLSRYEEMVKPEQDEHDRFPASASLSYQEGFLERPIIDEYLELVWLMMKQLWPGLQRKERKFSMRVSHDVDRPSRYGFCSAWQVISAMGGDLLKRGDITTACRGPWLWLNKGKQLHPKDPYNTFDWLMDMSERHGLTSAFFFICGHTHKDFDAQYEITHPAIRHLLRHIHERGHEVGLHASYNSYRNPLRIAAEAENLLHVCAEEGIVQNTWGGRMHYLRWETPTSLYGWTQAGITYDNTLTFADRAGFRCGTCHEYPAFDPVDRRPFKLRLRPLIAMDGTVMDKRYMGLGAAPAAFDEFRKLKKASQLVGGTFTLLWHNSHLATSQERELYEAVIKA